jgi:hypothetical protein
VRDGKELGNEEGQEVAIVSRGKKLSWGFTAYDQYFHINVGRASINLLLTL